MSDKVHKALWNPVISIVNQTQRHDADALLDFLFHLKLKCGDSKFSVRTIRRDAINMRHEYRVFDRIPDTQEDVTVTLGQLIDIASGAVPLILEKKP